jgi:hypothetical protein
MGSVEDGGLGAERTQASRGRSYISMKTHSAALKTPLMACFPSIFAWESAAIAQTVRDRWRSEGDHDRDRDQPNTSGLPSVRPLVFCRLKEGETKVALREAAAPV